VRETNVSSTCATLEKEKGRDPSEDVNRIMIVKVSSSK